MSFRFDWGGIDLCFSVEKGIIKEAVFYSDSLNPELMLALPEHLTGVVYQKDAICKALASHETADPQEQPDAFGYPGSCERRRFLKETSLGCARTKGRAIPGEKERNYEQF